MQKLFKTEEEYKRLREEGRLIILEAALDSTCYFLAPDCNKCTHAVYVADSKKCMYNLKTEMCYKHECCPNFNDENSLGRPEYWQVDETILSIYYNKLFKGKFGRSIFTDIDTAIEMAYKFNTLQNDCAVIDDIEDVLSYDEYIRLEAQNRIVILPCKVGEKYYVAEPDCTECKYKNDGYIGCEYIPKKGESPYTCNYDNEFGMCYVFNQSNGNTFYTSPERYQIQEISLMSESQYDLDRKSLYGVSVNSNALEEILKSLKNKSCS